MIRIIYGPDLVEEGVLLAERTAPAGEARAFRRERDRLYELRDSEAREAGFRALHQRWFVHFGLHTVIDQAVAAYGDLFDRVAEGRVLRALTRQDEGADLIDRGPLTLDGGPLLVLRVRPAMLLEPDRLRALLPHELMHVADMLAPAFGYQRTLPPSDDGPSGDNILRERYRVVWDVTIDGRLSRRGLADARVRDARWQEFVTTFTMLDERRRDLFDEWFDGNHPTHGRLAAFALAPNGSGGGNAADSGRCPLCRFPVASLDRHPGRLSAAALAAIEADRPTWRIELGLCSQCLDLYEAQQRSFA